MFLHLNVIIFGTTLQLEIKLQIECLTESRLQVPSHVASSSDHATSALLILLGSFRRSTFSFGN
jgi:hypothetical protein